MDEQASAPGPSQDTPSQSPPSSETFEGGRPSDKLHGPSSASLRPRPGVNGDPSPEATNDGQETSAQEKKRESRYEQTKRKIAALRERELQLAQREKAITEAEAARTKKPERNYTLDELKEYRQSWEDEGKWNLVEAADKKIAEIEAEEKQEKEASRQIVELPVFGTPEHKTQWEAAEQELAQVDSEFMRTGTRLDTELRSVMAQDGNIYRQHPRGIVAAYHRAKMNLLEADYKVAQGRIQELETELQRQTGLTSIGGGAPGRVGSGSKAVNSLKDFSRLSSKEMRQHLGRGAKTNSVLPWL